MRFTADGVDLDDEIITLLANNNLVIFVGAGVSAQAYPRQRVKTYYPTFRQLVYEIAEKLGRKVSEQEKSLLKEGFSDRILGKWEADGDDAHSITAQILTENEDEQRIDLHRAIIRLFPVGAEPRIVTTNFDNLLIRAVQEEGFGDDSRWKICEAPSLPPANRARFQGICFLHGRVVTPKEMILTDKDIGRAYMDEGWALRFAYNLFRNFSVLFLGYSLEDPPLRYLSLALEGTNEKKHWVFLPHETNEKKREDLIRDWRRRGVTPIWFPSKRRDFRAVERTIDGWAKDNRYGYIDKKNLLSNWGSSNPNLLPHYQLDRANYFLRTPELLRDFAENNLDENWFDKLVEWGHFDFILKSSGKISDKDIVLSQRIVRWLTAFPEKWMPKIAPYRRTINILLFEELCRHFEECHSSNIAVKDLRMLLEFFRPIISRDPSKGFSRWIGKLLRQLIREGFIDDAVWLFTAISDTEIIVKTTPNVYLEFAKASGRDVAELAPLRLIFDVDPRDQRFYHLRNYITSILIPNIKTIGYPLLVALSNQFLDLMRAFGRGGEKQYTYIRRKAIEDHDQDKHRHDVLSFFINALRDLWESLLAEQPDEALNIYRMWRATDDIFFRRLSLYAARRLIEAGNAK